MRTVTLDCAAIETTAGLHLQLAELLDLPEYYGSNLDALSDCLGDVRQDICLVLANAGALEEALGDYARRFVRVLEQAAGENPHFCFKIHGKGAHTMKLAEALQERADLNRSIQQLENRLLNNAIVQEGESPAEDPRELLSQLDRSIDRLEELTAAINLRNSTVTCDGETLTQMLARRDALTMRLRILRGFALEASATGRRARGSEIRVVSAVNVKTLQRDLDNMSRELRLLDNAIQSVNWSTDL